MEELRDACLSFSWPIRNILTMSTTDGPKIKPDVKGNFSGGRQRPWADKFSDVVSMQCSQIPTLVVAIVCWNLTVDMDAASEGYDFHIAGWASRIFFRDLFLMIFVCGGWDWLLYYSPLKGNMAAFKFAEEYPDADQFWRDRFWSTSATLLGSVQEVLLMRWWSSGSFKQALFGPMQLGEAHIPWGSDNSFFGSDYTATYVLWIVTMLYWRLGHFYWVHRAMHPWWDRENGLMQGDIGAVLYRYVHSMHHKSYNPTPWSGISMRPIESITYISAALIPLLFRCGCHPFIVLYTKLDLIIGAQIGHSGFDGPGKGAYFHQLHHAHFECNYGSDAGVPFDWIFGTFEDGTSFMHSGAPNGNAAPLLAAERSLTMEEVKRHNSRDSCWIVIDGTVLDVTRFLPEHPGGLNILLAKAGTDATKAFKSIHLSKGGLDLITRYCPDAAIGHVLDGASGEAEEAISPNARHAFLSDIMAQVVLNLIFVAVCAVSWFVIMGVW